MKFILEFKSYRPSFEVGEQVLIEYWYLEHPDCPEALREEMRFTPVVIAEKLPGGKLRVSHDIDGSRIRNAPDEVLRQRDIIARCR